IIIRSSALDANLPPPGTRIDPTYAAQMPKIVSPDSTPAFHTEPGAHHYRLVGLEISVAAGVPENYGLVTLGDSAETDLSAVPSEIEVRRKYFFKPLKWKPGDPSYDGFGWVVKNLMELKNAQRVLAEGNTYEHNWAEDQNGYAILFTVRNQDGAAPWSVVQDV